MKKHAFLIIAHKDDIVFRTLIKLLDVEENDIYIHMDKKNKSYNPKSIESIVQYSDVYHIGRTKISWGGYSQIDVEVRLLEEATKRNNYLYYHLLSGEDLPIKTQKYIHKFFDENQGYEFVRFQNEIFEHKDRINYYYLLQELLGRNKSKVGKIIRKLSIQIQKTMKIKRNKNIEFQKGTNWFSITDDFARYVVSKKDWIRKVFKNTICCDEIFIQTILINSNFKEKLYHKKFDNDIHSIMRLIDWNRGKPYTFREKDFQELKSSDMLFARKFQCEIDAKIVNEIYNEVNSKNGENYNW